MMQCFIWLSSPLFGLMTAAEVLFSITGLEFAYAAAPPSLKSVAQSAWLLTDAIGNVITVLLVETVSVALGLGQTHEVLLFAAGCGGALVWFLWLARGHSAN